jgi:hypothetical protein
MIPSFISPRNAAMLLRLDKFWLRLMIK